MRSTLVILIPAVLISGSIAYFWAMDDPAQGEGSTGSLETSVETELRAEGSQIRGEEASQGENAKAGKGLADAKFTASSDLRSMHDLPTEWRPSEEIKTRRSWPLAKSAEGAAADAALEGEPEVPVKVAFRALWYVGVDPEADKIWMKAINDPRHPPGVRSDLIEDLHDEGYSDNSHPTAADLPIILARMEMIERLAPYALDQVNADAFEEAYKDLLNKYLRLGGEPRK